MGVLTARGIIGEDGSMPSAPDPTPDPTPSDSGGGTEPQNNDKAAFVPFSAIEGAGRKPGSRREKAEREIGELIEARIKPLQDQWGQERQTYEQKLEEERRARSEHAQELARMRGVVETLQRQPQQAAQPSGPEPVELRRKAREYLAAGNIDEYERLNNDANEIVADRKAEAKVNARLTEFERRLPPQIPQHIQTLILQSPAVAAAGEKGIRAVIRMEQELEDDGVPQGYARTQKAFQMANAKLGKAGQPPQRPQYSQDSAASLAAIPTGRPATGGGAQAKEPGYQLTELERQTAKDAGMTAEQYAKWKFPDKWMKR